VYCTKGRDHEEQTVTPVTSGKQQTVIIIVNVILFHGYFLVSSEANIIIIYNTSITAVKLLSS
jgi:hypothetical protein